MKFGKRLAAEAARRWTEQYLDYKVIKKALKHDIKNKDATGQQFQAALLQELQKVSKFYLTKAEALEAALSGLLSCDGSAAAGGCAGAASSLAQVVRDIKELIKFVALNYLAVVKAIKKRNRHLRDAFGSSGAVPALHPLDLLSQEVFFTSPRLAALATRAELMQRGPAAMAGREPQAAEAVAAEYQCPICLDVLRSPVVLTCAHRFCWGCLVAHYAAVRGRRAAASHHHHHQHMHHDQQQQGAQGRECHGGCCQQQAGGDSAADKMDGCCGCCPDGAAADGSEGAEALVVLEKIVAASDCEDSGYYDCPLCRKPQVLNIESLSVDPHLAKFVEALRLQLKSPSTASNSMDSSTGEVEKELPTLPSSSSSDTTCSRSNSRPNSPALVEEQQPAFLLPPQLACHAGRLTVLLDLDGTLVSSFAPRKAPRLPRSMTSHLVGQGTQLNPGGVFVVERPGLRSFLERLAGFAEVVVFTAGLEEYAAPIIDAIDPQGSLITSRIYREGTTKTEYYQCVKDMRLVGRDLGRTVLVDDTPLAFLHQPHNGIPVLGFRGDPDDRLLHEAVLPLLQILSTAPNVQPVLERRFDMHNWFRRHGYPESVWAAEAPKLPAAQAALKQALGSPAAVKPAAAAVQQKPVAKATIDITACSRAPHGTLLLFDFDKTLTDFDAGERLVGELAPELLPQLVQLEMPANFVPVTNDVLREMSRRGVSRDKLLATLRALGAEVPAASRQLLAWAQGQPGLEVKVLSDANSVFISHILAGAACSGLVGEIITNPASFQSVALPAGGVDDAPVGLGCTSSSSSSTSTSSSSASEQSWAGAASAASPSSSSSSSARFHLAITPRHGADGPHGCSLCPANLCKGRELVRLAAGANHRQYAKVVYAGDGANDVCPALRLGPGDVLLARQGHGLAAYLDAAAADPSLQQVAAQVAFWDSHEELAQLVRQHAGTAAAS